MSALRAPVRGLRPRSNSMMELLEQTGDLAVLRVSGRIRKEDYTSLTPALERQIQQHGSIRALVRLESIEGIEPGAVVEEVRFDVAHRKDVERCAIVGSRAWHEWAASLGNTWFRGDVRCFEPDQEDAARAWLTADRTAQADETWKSDPT